MDYRRFISYLYSYVEGEKGVNVGYIRCEQRHGVCRLTLNLQDRQGIEGGAYKVYLYKISKEGNPVGYYLDEFMLRRGCGELRKQTDCENVWNTSSRIEDFDGILAIYDREHIYASQWSDEPLQTERFHTYQEWNQERTSKRYIKESEGLALHAAERPEPVGGVQTADWAKTAEPVQLAEGRRNAESMQTADWAKTAEPVQLAEGRETAESGQTADWAKTAEPVQLAEGRGNAESMQTADWTKIADWAKTAEPVQLAEGRENAESGQTADWAKTAEPVQLAEGRRNAESMQNTERIESAEAPQSVRDAQMQVNTVARAVQEEFASEIASRQPARNRISIAEPTLRLMEQRQKLPDFENHEIYDCVRIEPNDIGLLAMDNWRLGVNSFLTHGYYNYKYLMLGKLRFQDGAVKAVLGVPGVFDNKEQYIAKIFGFELFVPLKHTNIKTGNFGYWIVEIV